MPTHLVTGGSGYVGEAIINNLHALDQKVISLDVIEIDTEVSNLKKDIWEKVQKTIEEYSKQEKMFAYQESEDL